MMKIVALIPVAALMVACGGEQTPPAESPEGAAAMDESKPAEGGEAAPAEGGEAAPAEAAPAGDAAAPAGDAPAPAEGEAK